MTLYDDIYNRFLRKIEDPDLARLNEEDQYELLDGWLDEAVSLLILEGLTIESDLEERDSDSRAFVADLKTYEKEILSMLMAAAWYTPRINSIENTSFIIGTNSEKWTSQKDFHSMMTDSRDYWIIQAKKLLRDMSTRNNSYLND